MRASGVARLAPQLAAVASAARPASGGGGPLSRRPPPLWPAAGRAGDTAACRSASKPPPTGRQQGPEQQRPGTAAPDSSATLAEAAAAAAAPAASTGRHRALAQLTALEAALHAHVSVPGTPLRLGLDTALGRVPFAGVFAYMAVGGMSLVTAWRYGASPLLLARMSANIMLENSVRAVPIVGSWAAPLVAGGNKRNLQLLRAHIAKQDGVAACAGGAAAAVTATPGLQPGPQSAGVARQVLAIATWPIRHLSFWTLMAAVVLAPLAIGAGAVIVFAWSVLHWFELL